MKLPESTLIAPEKLSRYLLVPRLADDKSKFLAMAGYTRDGWQVLERDLREQILSMEAEEVERVKYGTVYEIRGNLQGPNGRILTVITIWMAEIATEQTKFVTLYPAKGTK
jgi:hypothetical protein